MCKDKSGKPKGYGFVVFSDVVAAELCVTVAKQQGLRVWRVRTGRGWGEKTGHPTARLR